MRSILKKAGGKGYLYKDILHHIKPTLTNVGSIYVEPFCGSFVVGMNLDLPIQRYALDIDKKLIYVWRMIRDYPDLLQKCLLECDEYKYSESNFVYNFHYLRDCDKIIQERGEESLTDKITYAASYIFVNRTSRSANMKDFGTSTRLRGKQNEYKNAYENAILNLLPLNALAIKDVIFDSGDYIQLMEKYGLANNKNVTAYFDPPYVHETRTVKDLYSYEFATYEKDVSTKGASGSHEAMIKFLTRSEITAYVSGYESDVYLDFDRQYLLPAGKKLRPVFTKEVSNNMAQTKKKSKRTEVLWRI